MPEQRTAFPASGRTDNPQCPRPGIPLVVDAGKPRLGMKKIGEVARRLGTSIQTIRLYENEGLLISAKSDAGTRWYNEDDEAWIARIQELLSQGVNFCGIRRLLAQIPCWALRPCRPEDHEACGMRFEDRMPCWSAPEKLCTEKLAECYECNAYRRVRECTNLKMVAELVPVEHMLPK